MVHIRDACVYTYVHAYIHTNIKALINRYMRPCKHTLLYMLRYVTLRT